MLSDDYERIKPDAMVEFEGALIAQLMIEIVKDGKWYFLSAMIRRLPPIIIDKNVNRMLLKLWGQGHLTRARNPKWGGSRFVAKYVYGWTGKPWSISNYRTHPKDPRAKQRRENRYRCQARRTILSREWRRLLR